MTRRPTHRNAILSRLDGIERILLDGDVAGARTALEDLRRRLDGCGGAPDGKDWIVDCAAQLQIRTLIDRLITDLGA